MSDCLHLDALDKTGGDWSELHHSPNADSVSHSAELHDVTMSTSPVAATGTATPLTLYGSVS